MTDAPQGAASCDPAPQPLYPEHEKLTAVADSTQTIGEFLDNSRFTLAEYRHVEGYRDAQLVPASQSVQEILADWFGIDLIKIEAEKRTMLASLRHSDAQTNGA